MSIPDGAKLEAIVDKPDRSPGIAVYDVSHLLVELAATLASKARDEGRPRKRPFGARNPNHIDTLIVHKSGGNGPAGYRGVEATTRFVVWHRGWDGSAYTLWLSREADRAPGGAIVVYRCQPDAVRSWHTGGRMNRVGIGLGVQGNYDGNWDLLSNGLPRIEREPTPDQWEALPLVVDWVEATYPGIICGREDPDDDFGLSGHWEHGKPVCPGDALRAWVEKRRGETIHRIGEPFLELPPTVEVEVDPYRWKPVRFQKALLVLGFDPGPLDGKPGALTRAALEEFQESAGIKADGWYGPQTARAMLGALRDRGLADREHFDETPPLI